MTENCLIGYTGFVGSYLMNHYKPKYTFSSANINQITNNNYDTVICCGVSAKKWYANKYPDEDIANINKLLDNIKDIKCNKFVLISTIDVYPNSNSCQNENDCIGSDNNHPYGKNRLYVENFVKSTFTNHHIIRLPGLFGFGLRKNIIYDLINNNNPNVDPKSIFQWYDLNWLYEDINYVIENNISLINLFTEPIVTKDILDIFADYNINKYNSVDTSVIYNLTTKYTNTKYWKSKKSVMSALESYIKKMLLSNLCVSNLSSIGELDKDMLKDFGVKNIEIAPFKTFGEGFIDKPLEYFNKWKNDNIYSMQSILYPNTNNIFDDNEWFITYMKKLIDISSYLNIKILVLGSPKNRLVGARIIDNNIIVNMFRNIGDYAYSKNIIICLEPNPKYYSCDYVTTSTEGYNLVKAVNSKGFKLHLDFGCMYLEKENIYDNIIKYIDEVYHMHISAPNLKSLLTCNNIKYNYLYNQLSKVYKYKFTLELLNQTDYDIKTSIFEIVRLPKTAVIGGGWYGCHIASKILDKGEHVTLFEQTLSLFTGASSKNQNRLHLGFHYARSYATRQLCLNGYNKFMEEYGSFVEDITNNYYVISNQSLLDFDTYLHIMQHEKAEFDVINDSGLTNCSGVIRVNEKMVNNVIAKDYFTKLLNRYIKYNTKIYDITSMHNYDYIYDCTNNQLNFIDHKYKLYYELTISLIYEGYNNDMAITVVDGSFCSLYPYDKPNNLYTLTHVTYTPLIKSYDITEINSYVLTNEKISSIRNKMEESITHYYPSFKNHFRYKSYFLSYKCKFENSQDSRDLLQVTKNNITSIMCGKITGIYKVAIH